MPSSAMPDEAARLITQLAERLRAVERLNRNLEAERSELARINARLAELAVTDELTGLKNRRYFREAIDQALALAAREGRPLSLAVADLDHFKSYNDTFGHPAGDEVLRDVARIMGGGVRAHDLVVRHGGEEFVLLLPATDAAEARILAERLRDAIAGHPWPRRPVAASFGIATATPPHASADRLIAEADEALYHAKADGRNRVAHHRDLPGRPAPEAGYPRVAS